MFNRNAPNPVAARRHALAKVYALLVRLAEENKSETVLPDNFSVEAAEQTGQVLTTINACATTTSHIKRERKNNNEK